MNRASDAAALDWIATASIDDLRMAEAAIKARSEELYAQSLREPEVVSQVYHNYGFCGAAQAFYRTMLPEDPKWVPNHHIADEFLAKNSLASATGNTVKPPLIGADIVRAY